MFLLKRWLALYWIFRLGFHNLLEELKLEKEKCPGPCLAGKIQPYLCTENALHVVLIVNNPNFGKYFDVGPC